jgi:hypothetical protein
LVSAHPTGDRDEQELELRRHRVENLSKVLVAQSSIWSRLSFLVVQGYDELRGSTTKPLTLMGRRHNRVYLYSLPVQKNNNPELFREFMVTHWIYATVVAGAGCILYSRSKKQDDL